MNRIERYIFERLITKPAHQTNYDIENTIVVSGSGRSGTTWLAEQICRGTSSRLLWEPFSPFKVPEIGKRWHNSQYLSAHRSESVDRELAQKILRGRIQNPWINSRNNKLSSGRRVVKGIRSNLLLNWLKQEFPEARYLLLIRHPYSVAYSRKTLGWEARLSDFTNQEALMEDWLHPYEYLLHSSLNKFEQHVVRWCVENYLPLRKGGVEIYFYENLVSDWEKESQLLAQHLGISNFNAGKRKRRASSSGRTNRNPNKPLEGASRKAEQSELMKACLDIISQFGLDQIYKDSWHPQLSAGQININ